MLNVRSFIRWLLLFGAALAVFSGAAAQETPAAQPIDPAALPFGDEFLSATTNPDHIDKLGDWSMLTYQKLVDQNWDIYVHDPEGPRRLTSNKAVDQQPSLDRGTRRVAFVSNRSGDFDLYLINSDGTGLQRILDNRTTIAFPMWSPDGTRIAIQARVGSQYEIYIVDADGQNPQRLTNHAAFDGMPTWSPDGTKLAFASNRTGDYHIYTMNTDGSELRRLSNYRNSLHPSWSPDGASIAFDADIDGDGWQELAIIEADGRNQRMIYNPSGNVTAWTGSWAPDSSGIGFNEITAARQGGNWVWTKAVIRKWNRSGGVFDLIPGGREWYMKWQSSDDIPPVSAIDALESFTRADAFTLRWSGSDRGGSGIQAYDVYFRSNDGKGWQTLLRNTTKTESAFPAQAGTTIEFLVRATDNAFNSGSWSQQTTQATTFYQTKIAGTVSDNRGNPLSGVEVLPTPSLPGAPYVSGWQGDFTGYRFEKQMAMIAIREPHFLALPNTIIPAGADFQRDFYVMPADSLIKNGTFERGAGKPESWTVGGNIPVAVSRDASASGEFALRFGQSAPAIDRTSKEHAGSASIAQVVTIPNSMPGPTLSYMLRTAASSPPGNSGLRVLIQPLTQRLPTAINATAGEQWQLQWIDMTPWQGQTVTVTFEWVQNAGETLPALFLDDISLGSSNPDLWISLVSGPETAVPGEEVAITLDYGNRGSLPAEEAVIELALPAKLELVAATPPYTIQNNVLRWEAGDLPAHGPAQRLQIIASPKSQSSGSASIRSLVHASNTESHLRNNTSEVTIVVAKKLYLPLLAGGSN